MGKRSGAKKSDKEPGFGEGVGFSERGGDGDEIGVRVMGRTLKGDRDAF